MIVGHQKQIDYLEHRAKDNSAVGAYIFSGPAQIGKKTIALEWLSHLFSQNLRQDFAHPDFAFVEPLIDAETGQQNKEIEIAQIKTLIEKLQLKPVLMPFKAAIIDQAHLLNVESQNALLKTLEEPPGRAIIILIADNVLRLLPTIVSRCEVIKFHFVSRKQMVELANANKLAADQKREMMLNLSLGRPGRLMDFASKEGEFDSWLKRLKQCGQIARAGIPERLEYVKQVINSKEDEDINELLELWQYYFREKLLEALFENKKESVSNQTNQKNNFVFTKNLQKTNNIEKFAVILEKINNLIILLARSNVSERLALENLLLEV